MSSLTKTKLVNLYKKENDSKVKERRLLVIKVCEDKQIPFRVVNICIEVILGLQTG